MRRNREIRISPVRLIDENNKQVGVVETPEALRLAEAAGLDLVEVRADARPPLCKIMDFGKYKYDQSKKKSSQSKTSKANETKEVRLGRSMKIDQHDIEVRMTQARKFLMEGYKVQLTQRFRGREMAHTELGMDRLAELVEALGDIAKPLSPPQLVGRQASVTLIMDKVRTKSEPTTSAQTEAEPEPSQAKVVNG